MRYTQAQKIKILQEIANNIAAEDEICRKHNLSQQELDEWRRKIDAKNSK